MYSYYADVGEQHIDEYLDILSNMMKDGTFPEYFAKKETIKQKYGHSVFLIGQKP